MKYFLSIVFLLSVLFLRAQLVPSILLLKQDTSFKSSQSVLLLNANGMAGGNAIDMLFLKKNIVGGHIEERHIERIMDNSYGLNRAGFALHGGLDFFNFTDTLFHHPEWGVRIQVGTNYHASLSYSKNLFSTIYQGNAQFAGDSVQLGPLSAQYQSWQKFGFGLFNKSTLSSVSLSLVAGEKYHSLIVQDMSMFTSATGDSLALSYNGDYMRSDTLKSGWANGSGLGLAIDADFNLPIAENKGAISIGLRDMGFVAWNRHSERFRFDSTATWKGVALDNLFDLATDTIDFPNLRDSVHYTAEKKNFIAPLPFSVHVRFSRFITATDYYEIGVSIWPNRAALPLVYAGMNHFIGDNFILSERISYGGYGTWGIGAEIQWMPEGSWLLKAGTQHLGGFTMGSAHSRDFVITVGRIFKHQVLPPDEPLY